MICPNCSQKMQAVRFDNQKILHCKNCGGSFFEENGINRITQRSAELLSRDKADDMISGAPKFCPLDHSALIEGQNRQSVPQDVIVLTCPKCSGSFFYPSDLVRFKKAQDAKIEYFKLWHKPIPALDTVLVLSLALVFSISMYVAAGYLLRQNVTRIQAEDQVNKFYSVSSGRYTLISFQTPVPYRSQIILSNKTTGEKVVKEVSPEPQTQHLITVSGFDTDGEVFYKILLTNSQGTIETDERKLEISR